MKKVLFTATVDSHILAFHVPFLKYFKEHGYEVHVATNGDAEIPYCDKKIKVSIERSPFKLANLKGISQLKQLITEEKYDIVHTHTPMGSVATRFAAKKARKHGTRVIYTAHGFHFFKGAPIINWLLFYPVEKYLSKYTDTLILINQEDYNLAKSKFKKCKDIQYIPGVGINEEKFDFVMTEQEKEQLRSSLNLSTDDFVLIYPAELNKNKNQEFLIQVIERLVQNHSNMHLLLAGQDSYQGYYQQLAKEKHLEDIIHFLGFRTDLPKLLQISDVAVASSKREGLPVNIMEAMYVGLPIVALDSRGTRDLVRHGKNGYLVEQGDIEGFASYIEELCLSPLQLNTMKQHSEKNIFPYLLFNILKLMTPIYNKKKSVLHLLSSSQFSGAENVACTIIQATSNDYDCYYCSPSGIIEKILSDKKIKHIPLKKMSISNINRIVDVYQPDIIHAHDFKASCLASKSKFKGKLISHIHQNPKWFRTNNIKTIFYKYCSKRFLKVIVVSNAVLDEYYYSKSISKKMNVIYNYVDKDRVVSLAKEPYDHVYDICYFGRLSSEKNPLFFIDIIYEYKKRYHQDILACMIGTGPLLNDCVAKIERLGLTDNIDLLGFCANPYNIVSHCSCVVMPSIYEGFGLAAIESLMLGIPVFNSGVGGLREIFENHEDYICSSVEEYVEKIYVRSNYEGAFISTVKCEDYEQWKKNILEIYN